MEPNVLEYVGSGGPVVILLFVLGMIVRGDLVTKRHLDDARADRDLWRRAYQNESEARVKESQAAEATMIQGQVAIRLLDDMRNSRVD